MFISLKELTEAESSNSWLQHVKAKCMTTA